jgi:uncharacterized membrane protein YhaH (DUF805 family)
MVEWYNNRYANFSGCATRSEYGAWLLFGILAYICVYYFGILSLSRLAIALNMKFLFFLLFIPLNAVSVRRIRDLGFNGGFVFLNFIPYINLLLIFCLLIIKGEDKKNAYGENPYELKIVAE